jgi:CO/xanthine dehydrogenase Mo-binding subunit
MSVAIGDSVPRQDAEAKIRGSAVYSIDYEEPHYLHGKILRSWLPAAKITKLDTSKAEAMSGVSVVTAADVPARYGMITVDEPLFAEDTIRYEGEPIVAVAADTWNQARAAIRACVVELEPLEVIGTMEEALADGARLIHEDWESYPMRPPFPRDGNVATLVELERGDVDAAFEAADLVVEGEYRTPRHAQASIEPLVCTVRYDDGKYVVHTSTQAPFQLRDGIAAYLGVRTSDVRIIVPTVGGGFGAKLLPMLEPIAGLLSKKSGRPVKLTNTRKEEFLSGAPRENAIIRIKTAVSNDGELIAHESEMLLDNGGYGGEQPIVAGLGPLCLCTNYRYGAIRHATKLVYTNTPPTGPFRGVLATSATFALERHADEIANALGMDRMEFRRKNLYKEGDLGAGGARLEGVGFEQVLDAVEKIAPWKELTAEKKPYRGVGVCCALWNTNNAPSGSVIKLNDDGTVTLQTAATEIGTGAVAQGLPQIVAAELGISIDDVHVTQPDTSLGLFDGGAQGGRTTYMAGTATYNASVNMREKILDIASGMLEADKSDLEMADGAVVVSGAPDRSVKLAKIARTVQGTQGPMVADGGHASAGPQGDGCIVGGVFGGFTGGSYHAHLAEVEVDPDTGHVKILRYVVAQDVGKIINRQAIEGQIDGGVVQGLGYALYEDLRLEDGICVDWGFGTYRLPTAADVPEIEAEIVEIPDTVGAYGVKGAAEAPIIPVAGAIANAVADALGKEANTIPLTPFAVLEAIQSDNGS